tara:strand:+ start:253 stop:504 length:252 start_codon:yes stop_codon:yes gene_type:complete
MNISWKEEVDEILQEQKSGFLTEDEAKERVEELLDLIPADFLEDIYEQIETAAFEVEEEEWTAYLNEQYDLLDDDDPDKEWVS